MTELDEAFAALAKSTARFAEAVDGATLAAGTAAEKWGQAMEPLRRHRRELMLERGMLPRDPE